MVPNRTAPPSYVSLVTLGLAALVGVALVGCGPRNKNDDPAGVDEMADVVADSAASTAAENDAESMTASLVAVTGSGLAPAAYDPGGGLHTTGIGDIARGIYLPQGCLTTTADAPNKTVTYDFQGCAGPYGLLGIRGKVVARYDTPEPNHLVFDLTATDLKVNRATVDWNAHADIVARGAQRTMTWKATLSGTTARGKAIERQNQKTVSWTVGEQCVALSGTSEGNLTGKRVKIEIPSYKRCRGSCPEAGSEIKVTNVDSGKTVSVRYGAADAVYTNANGKEITFTPACRQ